MGVSGVRVASGVAFWGLEKIREGLANCKEEDPLLPRHPTHTMHTLHRSVAHMSSSVVVPLRSGGGDSKAAPIDRDTVRLASGMCGMGEQTPMRKEATQVMNDGPDRHGQGMAPQLTCLARGRVGGWVGVDWCLPAHGIGWTGCCRSSLPPRVLSSSHSHSPPPPTQIYTDHPVAPARLLAGAWAQQRAGLRPPHGRAAGKCHVEVAAQIPPNTQLIHPRSPQKKTTRATNCTFTPGPTPPSRS